MIRRCSVATALYTLDDDDIAALHAIDAEVFAAAKTWQLTRRMDNERYWSLPDVPRHKTVREIEKDLARLKAHLNKQDGGPELVASVENTVKDAAPGRALIGKLATDLDSWLDQVLPVMDEETRRPRTSSTGSARPCGGPAPEIGPGTSSPVARRSSRTSPSSSRSGREA